MPYLPKTAMRYGTFRTVTPDTGELTNADSLPSVTVRRNGAVSSVVVTVINIGTGEYSYSYPMSGFVEGDFLEEVAMAVVGGVTGKQRVGEVNVDVYNIAGQRG